MTISLPTRVAVAVSGGVDSAVTALLLKNKGCDVIGVYMTNWMEDNKQVVCQADIDREFARSVCRKLDIEFKDANFVKSYWNNVFSYLLSGYRNGQTPNPDVMCNKFVKFGSFVDYCLHELNVEAIATGHYAGTSYGDFWQHYSPQEPVRLLRPKDKVKDQTLFLSQISQNSLRKVMFPLQHLLKSEVKSIAKRNGFVDIAKKPESKGICFIGKRNFKNFIDQYIEPRIGRFIDIETGETVGTHEGIHYLVIGQNCKLGGMKSRYYVFKKVIETNDILVVSIARMTSSYRPISQTCNLDLLLSDRLTTRAPNWICGRPSRLAEGLSLDCEFRFQHKDQPKPCRISTSDDGLYVELAESTHALNDGQFAVFYKDNECLGSAPIDRFWNSRHESPKTHFDHSLEVTAADTDRVSRGRDGAISST